MSDGVRLPSPVVQLARALANSPRDGVERYRKLQAGLPVELRTAPGYEAAVDAITELGGRDNVAELVSAALAKWREEREESRKRGYAALLGALADELASKAVRGGLDEQERHARSQILEQFYRESA